MQTLDDLRSGKLSGAKHLRLRGLNGVFPDEIYDLADTLEILDLNDNQLSDLPADFSRLTQLKTLFCSNNPFEALPEVLSDCPSLDMIGFKSCQLTTIPADALTDKIRWFIVTDNQIETLPDAMGDLTRLRKCMLAGNRLSALPESMRQCEALELLRLSANRFEHLPDFLFELPRLSWLTFAGNPLHTPFDDVGTLPVIPMTAIERLETLGEGASGIISKARWTASAPAELAKSGDIAFKDYKGAVTSDGFADDELSASIAAGTHPNLVPVLAKTAPPDPTGLVMSLIPAAFFNLGQPPSLQSCTRDVFPQERVLTTPQVCKILSGIADAMRHLRERDICHNDLYAHNILITDAGNALLTDFGAAANYASLPNHQKDGIERLEVRAFGCLIEDLIGCMPKEDKTSPTGSKLSELKDKCMSEIPEKRPLFSTICKSLST